MYVGLFNSAFKKAALTSNSDKNKLSLAAMAKIILKLLGFAQGAKTWSYTADFAKLLISTRSALVDHNSLVRHGF